MTRVAALVVGLVCLVSASAATAAPELVSRQSPARGGAPGDLESGDISLSGDGRIAAFASGATNLTDRDQDNGTFPLDDAFVHDRITGDTELLNAPGPLAFAPAVSANGRWVAFVTAANFHEPGVVRLRDLRTGTVIVAGKHSTTIGYAYPQAPPAISGDGRFVAFETRPPYPGTIRIFDRVAGRSRIIARAGRHGWFSGLSMSRDGSVVAYSRLRDGAMLPDGETATVVSVYRHDRRRDRGRQVARYLAPCCLIAFGIYGTALSDTGRYLAYMASDRRKTYRPRVFLRDAHGGRARIVSRDAHGVFPAHDPSIDAAGRSVSFTYSPFEGYPRVMVRDVRNSKSRVAATGDRGRLSSDGRWLGFASVNDPEQVFVMPSP
ncbi:MAG: hypothetical protein QOD53_2512 [Thermoleophilaceae bacterium]|nr:hypothetical protein [Thermoleophilaceae bacterium]